jgi:hypothetical protein
MERIRRDSDQRDKRLIKADVGQVRFEGEQTMARCAGFLFWIFS